MSPEPEGSDCRELQVLLSGMLDHELDGAASRRVEQHLERCDSCRSEIRHLGELSRELRIQGREVQPIPTWEALDHRLVGGGLVHAGRKSVRWIFPLAASLLMAVALGALFLDRDSHGRVPEGLALDLYTEGLQSASPFPFENFLSTHRALPVQPASLGGDLGFPPVVAEELPGGFHLENVYILKTSVSDCTYSCYRKGSEIVGVFQYRHPQPVDWDLKPRPTSLGGIACRMSSKGDVEVVQVPREKSTLTLVARRGSADLEALVVYLAGNGRDAAAQNEGESQQPDCYVPGCSPPCRH